MQPSYWEVERFLCEILVNFIFLLKLIRISIPLIKSCVLDLCSCSCGIKLYCLLRLIARCFRCYFYCLVGFITTIGIRVIASKTTAKKFEVEKFDGKNNFLLWKMRVTVLLVKEGTHKVLLGAD